MDTANNTEWKLKHWVAKPQSLELVHLQTTKKIEPKAMELLCYLIQHQGKVVSAQNLLEELWRGVSVSENSVRRLITQLRKALEDDANNPQFIETIPKRGYKLVCSVESQSENTSNIQVNLRAKVFIYSCIVIFLAATLYFIIEKIDYPDQPESLKTEILRITSTPGEETLPAINSDLSKVFYTQIPRLSNEIKIRVRDNNSNEDAQIMGFIGRPYIVAWSPDADQVAYVDPESCQIFIAQYNHDNKNLFNSRKISNCKSPYLNRLEWFEQGKSLYLSQYDSKQAKRVHFQYKLKHSELTKLDIGLDKFRLKPFRLLPHPSNNQWLVVTKDSEDLLSLWLFRPDMSEPQLILDKANKRLDYSWCINSNNSFVYSQGNQLHVFSDGKIESAGAFNIKNFAFMKCAELENERKENQRRKIVFSPFSRNTNLFIQPNPLFANKKASSPQAIYPSTQIDTNPVFSESSERLAFVSERNGKWQIWEGIEDSAKPLSEHAFANPPFIISWSPNETKLLLLVDRQPALLDLLSNKVEYLKLESKHVSYAHWGRNENEVLLSISEDQRIHSYQLLTQELTQLTHSASADMALAQDNQTLYFTRPDKSGLWRQNLKDNLEELIYPDFPLHSVFRAKSNGLYFHHHQTKDAGLYFYDFTTGKKSTVLADAPHQGHNFSLSSDASSIIYVYGESLESDIRMIDIAK